jgi:hypothetical protein
MLISDGNLKGCCDFALDCNRRKKIERKVWRLASEKVDVWAQILRTVDKKWFKRMSEWILQSLEGLNAALDRCKWDAARKPTERKEFFYFADYQYEHAHSSYNPLVFTSSGRPTDYELYPLKDIGVNQDKSWRTRRDAEPVRDDEFLNHFKDFVGLE